MRERNRILVFEDDPLFANELQAALENAGFAVSHRAHPDEHVVQTVLRERPDLLSLDVTMPVVDGFSAAAMIRSDPRTSSIPIVFLTNMGRDEDLARGRELGAAAYLVKSTIDHRTVVETYRRILLEYAGASSSLFGIATH